MPLLLLHPNLHFSAASRLLAQLEHFYLVATAVCPKIGPAVSLRGGARVGVGRRDGVGGAHRFFSSNRRWGSDLSPPPVVFVLFSRSAAYLDLSGSFQIAAANQLATT